MITVPAGTLCWFKYANILAETVNGVLGRVGADPPPWERVVLPIGLSFIVLQAISYLVDVWRGTVKAQRSFNRLRGSQGDVRRADRRARSSAMSGFSTILHAAGALTGWRFSKGSRRFMVGMSMKVLVADSAGAGGPMRLSRSPPPRWSTPGWAAAPIRCNCSSTSPATARWPSALARCSASIFQRTSTHP